MVFGHNADFMGETSMAKIAVVTGAGSGVGRAAALSLLRGGYSVVLAGRRMEPLEETVALAKGNTENCLCVTADVSNEAAVDNLFKTAVARFGRVDVLFNNAGINVPSVPLAELSLANWQSVVDINLTGMFLCMRAAFRVMQTQSPQGGRVINNGSISAHAPRPNSYSYTATKHAVTGLTKTGSLEGRQYNIAVGQIDIGNAATEMAMRMAKGVPQADGQIRAEPLMEVGYVGDAVLQTADLPLSVNMQFMTIMATAMPFVGRG
jgi:NAD(P)-dependent dehydrogenase (short-subunit alcohol dehydrogenase family)